MTDLYIAPTLPWSELVEPRIPIDETMDAAQMKAIIEILRDKVLSFQDRLCQVRNKIDRYLGHNGNEESSGSDAVSAAPSESPVNHEDNGAAANTHKRHEQYSRQAENESVLQIKLTQNDPPPTRNELILQTTKTTLKEMDARTPNREILHSGPHQQPYNRSESILCSGCSMDKLNGGGWITDCDHLLCRHCFDDGFSIAAKEENPLPICIRCGKGMYATEATLEELENLAALPVLRNPDVQAPDALSAAPDKLQIKPEDSGDAGDCMEQHEQCSAGAEVDEDVQTKFEPNDTDFRQDKND